MIAEEVDVMAIDICVRNTWASICAIARRQDNRTTFGSSGSSVPYIVLSNALTLIVSESAPVVSYVMFAYIVHRYRIVCILTVTCNRS